MIGNDVVDLALATTQSNWKRKGYLDKIFTNLEQEFILKSSNPNEMVWSLWSRKEAVYKIIIQKGGIRGYYPKKIECMNSDFENGLVAFENQLFYTITIILNDLIHSLAVENNEDFDKISGKITIENLKKINEIPFYELDSKLYAASKSHHGKFEKSVYLQS
ncbi:4'-phosphopantetheinyl transferase superfamily protein [Flavobacterium sp. SUN052]|uniref:4'-phosphopantetheinyl transferase family protein n=1 Tax=Flavobacterium sp. SUN052 TaxID=3002441 RepID=UPI00237E74B5|nr:4'-phosphopantetheinyl transferase superfamily protein [Flavobacterium sp. SUN052]MEC4005092.1 4'-phosphopantetheinyl transferase superfamily protein [Flavobacterium sp. SUN052]